MFAQGADGFWRYAAERQRIFEARHRTQIESLEETEEEREKIQSYRTRDKILRKFHFTNIYRFTDRGAQYMIQKVIRGAEKTTEDVLFRIFLYQMFNRESTWEAIEDAFGQVTIQRFTMNDFNEPLIELAEAKKPVYTNAYVTFGNKGGYKYNFEKHVALARKTARKSNIRIARKFDHETDVSIVSKTRIHWTFSSIPTLHRYNLHQR